MKSIRFRCLILLIMYSVLYAENDMLFNANHEYRNGNYHKALSYYKESISTAPNPALVFFNIANCWYQLDSLPQAAVYYELSITEAPDFFRAYLNLGIIKYSLCDYPGTIAVLEHARQLEPTNTQLLLILSSAYQKLQCTSKAVPLLEEAVSIDPNLEKCYFLLYEANYELGDQDAAENWLYKCPDSILQHTKEKYSLLSQITMDKGLPDKALSFLRKAIDADNNEHFLIYKYVSLLHKQEASLLAMEEIDNTLIKIPDFAELALLGGSIAMKLGYFDRAEKYFFYAYNNSLPDGLVGLQNLIVQYESIGDFKAAEILKKNIINKKSVSSN